MKYNNPATHVGERRQSDEVISVYCPKCGKNRSMKMACYFGKLEKPYEQLCGSCVQLGKMISEEQRHKISEKLIGITRSDEFKKNLSEHMKTHPDQYRAMLEVSSSRFAGKHHTPESAQRIAAGNKGKKRTQEQRQNISDGRKKMLTAQGGLLSETKEKLSKATIDQYRRGFEPRMFHRKGRHVTFFGENIPYRSSYEKRAFMLLDIDDEVARYDYEPFPIVYKKPDANYESNYLIDLLVKYKDGTKTLIEVKPEKRLEEPLVKAKIEAANKFAEAVGFRFEVWTEKELFGGSDQAIRKFVEQLDKK